MIETLILCFIFLAIGFLRNKPNLAMSVCSWVIIASLLQFIPNDVVYNTSIIITLSFFTRFTKNKIIKSVLLILTFYYFTAFILAVLDAFLYLNITWELIASWASLYDYVYYSTIVLILAGLAKSNYGGLGVNRTSNKLLFNDYNSANFKWF